MNLKGFTKLMINMHGTNLALMARSAPGVGKTSSIRSAVAMLAGQLGLTFYDTRDTVPPADAGRLVVFHHRIASTYDAPDVRGFNFPSKAPSDPNLLLSTYTWPDIFPVPEVLERAAHVFVFVDELGQAGHDVAKPMANILLEQSIGTYSLKNYVPNDCRCSIIAASNRTGDRSGVVKELAFLTNRMGIYDIEFSMEGLQSWLNANNYHPMASSFIGKHSNLVADSVPDKPGPFFTPRSFANGVLALSQLHLADGGKGHALPMTPFATEVLSGWIGEGAASQFMAHVKLAEFLPEPADILADPANCKLAPSNRLDAAYVIATYVARWMANATKKDGKKAEPVIGRYLEYIGRMPEDLQIMAVKTATSAEPTIATAQSFVDWALAHRRVIIAANA